MSEREISASILENWLFWAGSRLVALPTERIFPTEPRVCWPDYSVERFQILEFRRNNRIRVSPPSKDEIPIMDEILLFPNLCCFILRRRVIHLRLLTNPVTLNPINSWNKVSKTLATSVPRSKRLYYSGLAEIADKIPPEKIRFIADYFAETESAL